MTIWLKSAAETTIGLVLWYISARLWRLRCTRSLFIESLDDPRAIRGVLEIAKMVRPIEELTEDIKRMTGKEKSASEEDGVQMMAKLATLVPHTFRGWKLLRNWLLVAAALLITASYFVAPYLVLLNLLILSLLGRYLGFLDKAYTDAPGALLPIVKVVVQWSRTDPEGCKQFCTQTSPQFKRVFEVVSEFAGAPIGAQ